MREIRSTHAQPTCRGWGGGRRGVLLLALAACAIGTLSGCTWFRSPRVPLSSTTFVAGREDAAVYALLLPGRGDTPGDYARAGFPRALVGRGFAGEIVAADAHLQYYVKRLAIPRVHEDVVVPRAGRKPWIVGISLGGLGTLLYEKEHPGEAAGLVLLAPFVGDPELIAEIKRAGGLAAWEPGVIAPGDYQRELWAWIKGGGLARVPVFLAWGESDRFAEADALLATLVPKDRVVIVPGGHTWST